MLNSIQEKQRKKLRENWESPKRWDRELTSIRSLFEATCVDESLDVVDEKTWHDLDMNSVFKKIDATQTSVGQQFLYRKMRMLQNPGGKLEDDYRIASLLRGDQHTREELQVRLNAIKEGDGKAVTKMLFEGFPIVNISRVAVILWSAFSLATIVFASIAQGAFIVLIPVLLMANFAISAYFHNSTDRITYVFYHLYNIVATTERIAKLENPHNIPACHELRHNIGLIRKVRRVLKLLSISQHHDNVIVNNIMYFLNLIVLYDLIVYSISIRKVLQYQEILRQCYLTIGSIDSTIAIASYTHRNPHICNPKLDPAHTIELVDAYHPLIDKPVSNSFTTKGSSALVTGSNMAGKTTFIKTIGVNLILARTLWFCHASKAQLPVMKVLSSIKTEDGLEEGKSFYFSELERLNTFVRMGENGESCLFLIDEIYRGTNTVERVAGAAAVLEELAANNIVFVTTHDIELAGYLNKQYDMWYFEETGSKIHPFDYKLRSGVCETRNALKLMGNLGYPERITERAIELARQIEANS